MDGPPRVRMVALTLDGTMVIHVSTRGGKTWPDPLTQPVINPDPQYIWVGHRSRKPDPQINGSG